jgi:Fic family protein
MKPLLPVAGRETLAKITCDILAASGRLTGQVHSPEVLRRVAGLVREMSCYYSNLIEGHKTTPWDIERALKQDFSADETQRNHQQLGLAHIAVEKLMVDRLAGETVDVYGSEFICWLHREFYQRLPEPLHWAKTLSGQVYRIEPGRLRDFMVDVGQHTSPQFYGSKDIIATDRLTAIAAAHHRLAWNHPFGDGNGRVIRLHSKALMIHHGLDGGGLWTLSRGLARHRLAWIHPFGDGNGRGIRLHSKL